MPLLDVEHYDDDVVPFLDVAVCDDNESMIGGHSTRSGSSEIPRVVSPDSQHCRMPRRRSIPVSVVKTSTTTTEGTADSDDELSCAHSVRTNNSNGRQSQLQSVSVRSRRNSSHHSRFFSSILSMEETIEDKLLGSSKHVRERTIDLAVVGDECDSNEDDRVTYLEEEVSKLNSELTDSQAKHAMAKVEARQLEVELEDLQAFCKRLQEQNKRLQEENAALRRGGPRRWFGLQPLKQEAKEEKPVEEEEPDYTEAEDQPIVDDASELSYSSPDEDDTPHGDQSEEVPTKDEKRSWWGFGGARKQPSTEEQEVDADEDCENETD